MNEAIENEYRALNLFQSSGSDAGIAYASTSLGNFYHDLGQDQEAIKHHLISLEIKEKLNDKRGMANSYLNLSTAYLGLKNFDKALEYVNKSIVINKELQLKPEQVKYLWQIAIIHEERQDTIAALSAYDKAIFMAEEIQYTSLVTEIRKNKEKLLSNKIKEKNIQELLEQLTFFKTEKDSANVIQSLKYVTQWYSSHNNFKEAYRYQQEYYELQKSMFGPEVLNRMKQLETKYEISQRENTIALLKKENEVNESKLARRQLALYGSGGIILLTLIAAYLFFTRNRILQENRRLIELERIRNDIARDLHDDVGSTISSIQIISELIRKKIGRQSKTLSRSRTHYESIR